VRILICSLEAPLPPTNGLRLMLQALLSELRKEHEVRVLAFRSPDQTAPNEDPAVRLISRRPPGPIGRTVSLVRAMVTRRPLGVQALAARLRRPLQAELADFRPDVVHVTTQELALTSEVLGEKPSVLAALDAWHLNVAAGISISSGLRRFFLRRQLGWVRRFEGSVFRRFARVVVVSEQDRGALLALDRSMRVVVIPNGVDVERFVPAAADEAALPVDRARILFTGVMRYPPNVAAAEYLARDIMPLVRARVPQAHLAIVGREPSPSVRTLSVLDGIEVIGEVPDLRPWLTGSRVYTCPMVSGTGIKNKLLEAMACGVPCVATPLAARGLTAQAGRDLLVASDAEKFASHVVAVLTDDRLAARLGAAGRDYVTANHDWATVARDYVTAYMEATGTPPS
jgi:glycosyltransferase involved in cell wall biosynthesis